MVKQDTGTRLKQILVDEAHDANIVLGASSTAHDGVVVINHLFERADTHWATTHVIDPATLVGETVDIALGTDGSSFLGSLGLAEALLVLDVLLLEDEMVVNSLHSQQAELASARGEDGRELGRSAGAGSLSLLAADSGGRAWGRLVLGLLLL